MVVALLLAALAADDLAAGLRPAPPAIRAYAVAWSRPLVPPDLLDWQLEEPGGVAVDPASGTAVVGSRDGGLRAFTPAGVELWEFQARQGFAAPPLLADGVAFAGSLDGKLYAVELATGKLRWAYEAGEEVGSTPVRVGGLLVFSTLQESVLAVDERTGTWRWHHRRDQREGFSIRGCARPVLAGGLVVAGYADGHVAALDPATGAPRWERQVAPTADFMDVDGLATDGKAVFAAAFSGLVAALDPATGKTLWEQKLPGALRVLAADGLVYAAGQGKAVALSARDGAPRWTAAVPGAAGQPIRVGARLLVPGSAGLAVLDAAGGRPLRTFAPGTGTQGTPAALGARVYALSNGGTLFALDLE